MKNFTKRPLIIFLALISFSISNFTSAQSEYKPMLNEQATWNYDYLTECVMYTPYYLFHYSLLLEGDTIINGETYKKLIRPAWEFTLMTTSGGIEDCSWGGPATGYIGALRENEAERKVYYVSDGLNSESLLYDFNLEVGDTLLGYFNYEWLTNKTIDSVDSVLVGDQYHKRWTLYQPEGSATEMSDIQFIEGIGGVNGLVDPSPFFLLHSPVTTLICYNSGTGNVYPGDALPCALITDLPATSQTNYSIQVFPNPAMDSFTVLTSADLQNIPFEIQATDITGRVFFSQKTTSSNQLTINTSQWPAGIYILNIQSDKFNQSTKVIVN
jgi:hypothetical protein